MKLKLAYFGAPDFSACLLRTIMNNPPLPFTISCVITHADQPVDRKKILTPTPVKTTAERFGVPVFYTMDSIPSELLKNIDLCLVYAYGKIIPAESLSIPQYGFWNIHPSLLPRYRGPSPLAYPLFLGERETGVTLMQMDQRIDHGHIIAQQKMNITPSDKRLDLEKKLTDKGYELFVKTIVQFISTKYIQIALTPQDHQHATYTRLLSKEDGFVALEILQKALDDTLLMENKLPSLISEYLSHYPHEKTKFYKKTFNFSFLIFNLFKALHPWPGIWTKALIHGQEKRLKLTHLSFENDKLYINKVQLEGKKEVNFNQFNSAYTILNIKS